MRAKFCATPQGETPDLSALPEPLLARLRGSDGQIDPERLAAARARICAEGAAQAGRRLREGAASSQANANANSGASGRANRPRGRGIPSFGRNRSGTRYFLSLTHTIELDNTILIAPGVPLLDQLDGDATATFGLPRHSTTLSGGIFSNGIGLRIRGSYLGSTAINGSEALGSSNLAIDDLATVNLRIFANIGQITGKDSGFLNGLRLSLRADNLFDGRRIVRDDAGDIPLRFQPLLIDPRGRYLGVQLRKLF
jgi:hypothetical protein